MKNYLRSIFTIFFAFLMLFSVQSIANEKEIVDVPDLATLRTDGATDGTVYRVTGEIILTHQNGNRNQKYFQDDTGAILVDDNSGIITTAYNEYDGITGLTGTLSLFNQLLQLVPTEDPGEAVSEGNIVEPLPVALADLDPMHQSMLVIVHDVSFVEPQHDNFQPSTSYNLADGSGEGTLRTPNANSGLDYFGAPIPDQAVDMVAIVGQFHASMQIFPRGLADMGITEMHNVAALRNQVADNETIYTLTSEAILTYQESWRNSKYIQDETAGILIDDAPGTITTGYDIYDGLTGIQGRLSIFGNMLQFVPVEDPGPATSSDNVVEPVVLTMEDYLDNFMHYQARLVTIENVYFLDAGETFANGQIYDFTDDEFVAPFRSTFFGVDYIGDPIPSGELNLTGLPNSRNEGDFLTARNWGDIESLTTFAVTFHFFDEADQAVDGVTLQFRGETLTEAPYEFPEVPVGTHQFIASKAGYHTTQGSVSVSEGDVVKEVILVEIDPDMVTEFPWTEHFDGTAFPPQGWSHYVLGDGNGWELQNEQAYHSATSQGQTADSWLITPQIQLPEDESLLLTFLERNQFMADYGYSGVLISAGSGNPEHGHFTEIYESSANIGIDNPSEKMLNLSDYAGHVIYIAFNYQGEFAHRWWVDDVMIDFAPEAIEVPNLAALKQQSISNDLIYRVTGEVIITCLQLPYRNQFYIQDETAAILIDDAPGIVTTEYQLYDGITGFTGHLGQFQNMLQILPTEDPGEATSHDNEVEPLVVTLADIEYDSDEIPFEDQGKLVLIKNVSFDMEASPAEFTHNESFYIFDDTAEGLIRTPNSPGLFDYFGTPVPDTPKDIIGVLHQRWEVVRLQPRMLADFMEPSDDDDDDTGITLVGNDHINIYPNPAASHITIESGSMNMEQIRLFSMNGQLVFEKATSSTSVQIDVSTMQNGIYILQISGGNEVVTSKLSISK